MCEPTWSLWRGFVSEGANLGHLVTLTSLATAARLEPLDSLPYTTMSQKGAYLRANPWVVHDGIRIIVEPESCCFFTADTIIVVCFIWISSIVTSWISAWSVYPVVPEVLGCPIVADVTPLYCNKVVSVRASVLVHHTKGVEQLMGDGACSLKTGQDSVYWSIMEKDS